MTKTAAVALFAALALTHCSNKNASSGNLPSDNATMAVGTDGNIWLVRSDSDAIDRVSPNGAVSRFPVSPFAKPVAIVSTNDGELWFTERQGNRVGRIDLDGTIHEFAIPTPNAEPTTITVGRDGSVWFFESHLNRVGHATPNGLITEYALPDAESSKGAMQLAGDGALWVDGKDGAVLYRIPQKGQIATFPVR